jgi:hypothetical protein
MVCRIPPTWHVQDAASVVIASSAPERKGFSDGEVEDASVSPRNLSLRNVVPFLMSCVARDNRLGQACPPHELILLGHEG